MLEAGASGREVVLSPWVFLSGLQGSGHNSLNWFLLLHIQDRATESQMDFFSFTGTKVDRNFLSSLRQNFLFSQNFALCHRSISSPQPFFFPTQQIIYSQPSSFCVQFTVKERIYKHSWITAWN